MKYPASLLAVLIGPAVLAAAAARADQATVRVGATPGGCVQICKDIGYCLDLDIDPRKGMCVLTLDRDKARAAGLLRKCPAGQQELVDAVYSGKFSLLSSCVLGR